VASYAVGDWFPRAVVEYFDQPLSVAILLYVGVFTFMAAVYYMAFGWTYRRLAKPRRRAWLPFLAAAAWVAAEIGRGRLLTGSSFFIGNPWGLIGYSQADSLPLVQIAAVTGIYGIGFAVVCVNAALAEVWIDWRAGVLERRCAIGLVGLATLPAILGSAYGVAALYGSNASMQERPAIPIAVAQGNVTLASRWKQAFYGKNLDVYLRLTRDALQQTPRPEIVFWPEASMTFFLESEPTYRHAIARVLREEDAELVAGGVRAVGEPPTFSNSIYVVTPDGAITGRYDKEHLVPFAEYFPLDINLLRRRFGRVRNFVAGASAEPVSTRAGAAGIVVCNEAMLPEVVAERVARGAVYLVNPTNDSWISAAKYTEQQFDIARLRAIEQRRYLVRASTAGPSAVIDPWGRVSRQVEPLTRGFVQGEVRPIEARTIYGRVGDLFAGTCVVVVAVALLAQGRSSRADALPATR
jgi:apolipoprotein N-acyltransferase